MARYEQALFRVKSMFFDARPVLDAADRAARKVLSRFGAFVRRRAKSSIKKAPKKAKTALKRGLLLSGEGQFISGPGQPPVGHVGTLRDAILFSYDPGNKSVVIGPVPFQGSGRGARALEEGGPSVKRPSGRTVEIRPRPYMRPAFLAELPKVGPGFKGSVTA
jgi:hypothetical protein